MSGGGKMGSNRPPLRLIKAKVALGDPFTSAQFALEMIEGVEKVRFHMQS